MAKKASKATKPRLFFTCTESQFQAFQAAASDDVRPVNDWAKAALEVIAESGMSIREVREALQAAKVKANK